MATLHIEHAISDLPTWLRAFSRFEAARRRAGVRAERVLQPIDDDKYIYVDLTSTTSTRRPLSRVPWGVESVLEKGSFGAYPPAASWSVPLKIELCSTRTQKWASGAGTPWPRHRKGAPMQGKRMRGESAKQVAIDVLRAAGEPLHTKEITKRVIESGRSSGLKGKTPEATVAAMLAVGSKPGGSFKRVDKGTYTLADDLAESATAKPKKPEAKPRPKRTSGNARMRTSRNAQTAA